LKGVDYAAMGYILVSKEHKSPIKTFSMYSSAQKVCVHADSYTKNATFATFSRQKYCTCQLLVRPSQDSVSRVGNVDFSGLTLRSQRRYRSY